MSTWMAVWLMATGILGLGSIDREPHSATEDLPGRSLPSSPASCPGASQEQPAPKSPPCCGHTGKFPGGDLVAKEREVCCSCFCKTLLILPPGGESDAQTCCWGNVAADGGGASGWVCGCVCFKWNLKKRDYKEAGRLGRPEGFRPPQDLTMWPRALVPVEGSPV